MRLQLASRNEHKRQEYERLLIGYQVDLLPTGFKLPPETGRTYAENAIAKAHAAAKKTGQISFADDSGIEAAALDGAPGIRSARYAGQNCSDADNVAKLIASVPAGTKLIFVCVIAYADPAGPIEKLITGTCAGKMAKAPKGSSGFGYDPIFIPDNEPSGKTMAELSPECKDAISHRGDAVAKLLEWLES